MNEIAFILMPEAAALKQAKWDVYESDLNSYIIKNNEYVVKVNSL